MKTKCITSARSNKKSIQSKSNDDLISVILMCDSPGHRMRSYGPVSLVQIKENKLIDIQIQAIKSIYKKSEIILCLGFDAEKVAKYVRSKYKNSNIRIVENQLYNSSNSCESLRLSLNNICNDKVLICDGNLLFDSECLVLVDTSKSVAIIEQNPHETMEIGLNIDNNHAQYFSFGAKNTWSEIIFINGYEIIESLKKAIIHTDNKNRFMFEALNDLINMKYNIETVTNPEQLIKINNIKAYHKIKE